MTSPNPLTFSPPTPADEATLLQLLQSLRWADQPRCPRCGGTEVTTPPPHPASIGPASIAEARPAPQPFCRPCRKRFSPLLGTILENSHLPLRIWMAAFHFCSCSHQLPTVTSFQQRFHLRSRGTAHRLRTTIAPFVRLARLANQRSFPAPGAQATAALRLALNAATTADAATPKPAPPPPPDPATSGPKFVASALATLDRLMAEIASQCPLTEAALESRSVLITRIARGLRDVNKYVLAPTPAAKPHPVETLRMEEVHPMSVEEWNATVPQMFAADEAARHQNEMNSK